MDAKKEDKNVVLSLAFPMYTIAGKEENPDSEAKFDDVSPGKGNAGKTMSGNPAWVKHLPQVGVVWSPIVLDDAIPIFDYAETARAVIGNEALVVKFGDIDVVELHSPEDIAGWIDKVKVDVSKVRWYILAKDPVTGNGIIGVAELPIPQLHVSIAKSKEEESGPN